MKVKELLTYQLQTALAETASAGATSAANVGIGAVYPNKPAKIKREKDGTVPNAVDLNINLLTGGSIKRN